MGIDMDIIGIGGSAVDVVCPEEEGAAVPAAHTSIDALSGNVSIISFSTRFDIYYFIQKREKSVKSVDRVDDGGAKQIRLFVFFPNSLKFGGGLAAAAAAGLAGFIQ